VAALRPAPSGQSQAMAPAEAPGDPALIPVLVQIVLPAPLRPPGSKQAWLQRVITWTASRAISPTYAGLAEGSVQWSGGNALTELFGRADRKGLRAPGARLAGGLVIGQSGPGLCCDTQLQTRIESDDRQYPAPTSGRYPEQ